MFTGTLLVEAPPFMGTLLLPEDDLPPYSSPPPRHVHTLVLHRIRSVCSSGGVNVWCSGVSPRCWHEGHTTMHAAQALEALEESLNPGE